jgi:hypothetical protein
LFDWWEGGLLNKNLSGSGQSKFYLWPRHIGMISRVLVSRLPYLTLYCVTLFSMEPQPQWPSQTIHIESNSPLTSHASIIITSSLQGLPHLDSTTCCYHHYLMHILHNSIQHTELRIPDSRSNAFPIPALCWFYISRYLFSDIELSN